MGKIHVTRINCIFSTKLWRNCSADKYEKKKAKKALIISPKDLYSFSFGTIYKYLICNLPPHVRKFAPSSQLLLSGFFALFFLILVVFVVWFTSCGGSSRNYNSVNDFSLLPLSVVWYFSYLTFASFCGGLGGLAIGVGGPKVKPSN